MREDTLDISHLPLQPHQFATFLHLALCLNRLTCFGLHQQASLCSGFWMGSVYKNQKQEMGEWEEREIRVSVP